MPTIWVITQTIVTFHPPVKLQNVGCTQRSYWLISFKPARNCMLPNVKKLGLTHFDRDLLVHPQNRKMWVTHDDPRGWFFKSAQESTSTNKKLTYISYRTWYGVCPIICFASLSCAELHSAEIDDVVSNDLFSDKLQSLTEVLIMELSACICSVVWLE